MNRSAARSRTSARPTSRAGRSSGGLLLALVLAGALIGGLVLLLGGERDLPGAVESAADPGATGRAAPEAPRLERPGARAADTGPSVLGPGELVIPVGVRLGGEGRLEGTVRERASGLGVEGVRVDLHVVPPAGLELVQRIWDLANFDDAAQGRYRPVATVASEADGRFAFEGVRAGDYFLEPRGAWHVPDNLAQVTVAPSGAGGPVDVWVRPGGRVLGQVLRPDGTPAAGAKVWCFPGPGTVLRRLREGDVRGLEVRADSEGRYVVHGVSPGPGFEVAALAGAGTLTHVPGVTVEAGGDTVVDVRLRAGGALQGRVLSAAPGEEPRPLAEAQISLVPRGLRDLHFAREVLDATHAVTDAEGRFTARRVPPGPVDVLAWAPDHLHGMQGGLVVLSGSEVKAPDLVLKRGPTLELIVRDDTGAPVEGATASWWATDWSAFRFRFGFTPFLVQAVEGFEFPVSDAEGRLVAGPFPGTPPHQLAVVHPAHAARFLEWSPDEAGPVDVTLQRGGGVEGIVMDLTTGQPVPRFTLETGARLEPDPTSPNAWNPFAGGVLVEDPSGRFALPLLAPGTTTLEVRSDGHQPATVEVSVTAGETTRGVIVTLLQGGQVRGRVVDAEGLPIAGATVLATDANGDPVRGWPESRRIAANDGWARQNQDFGMDLLELSHTLGSPGPGAVLTDAEGAFELTAVPPGPVHVAAWHRDYARTRSGPLQVPAQGALEEVEVVLRGGGAIEGTVTDRHGRPVPDAIVVASRPDGFRGSLHGDLDVYQGQSDSDGAYAIEHVPPGSYFLFVTRGDEALDPLAFLGTMNFDLVRVPADTRVTYDLVDTSAAGTRVFGVVTSGGQPVRGGSLFALSFEGENLFGVDAKVAEVQADGRYEFPGLEPGLHQVRYGGEAAEVVLEVEVFDEPSQRLDLELPEGGLAGRVVARETGEPIQHAEVLVLRAREDAPGGGLFGEILSSEGGRVSVQTDAEGRFALPRLQEGSWELVVNPPRWGPDKGRFAPTEPRRVAVEAGVTRDDLELALDAALLVRGVVRDAEGEAVANARVTAYPREGGLVAAPTGESDAEGQFELLGLSAGEWAVGAAKADYADAPLVAVSLGAGAPPEIALVLSRGVPVQVRVLGPDGQPAPGATARLTRLDGETLPDEVALRRTIEGVFEGQGIAGTDGLLELGRHAPGRYRLEALRGGRSGVIESLTIESGGAVLLEVALD